MLYYIRQNTKYTSSGHYFSAILNKMYFRAHNAILQEMVLGLRQIESGIRTSYNTESLIVLYVLLLAKQ